MILTNLYYLQVETFNNGQHASLYDGMVTRCKDVMSMAAKDFPKGVEMRGVDKIRNHLLDFFETDEQES